jgi:hypothetical protein
MSGIHFSKFLVVIAGVIIWSCLQPAYSHQTKQTKAKSTSHTQRYVISAYAGEHGKLSPSGKISVDQGGNVAISVAADSGWRADSVIVDGVNQGALATYTFTIVSANHLIRATFTKIGKDEMEGPITSLKPNDNKVLTISTLAGVHGSVSPAGNQYVSQHGQINFSIAADSGYAVDSLMVDGVNVGSLSSYTFNNVMYDHVLVATFTKKK